MMSWLKVSICLAVSLSLCSSACSDDEGNPALTDDASPDMDSGVAPDAEPGAADAQPDPDAEPEPQSDRERILFIPETSSRSLPGLSAPVHVVRTEMNVPHFFAQNRADLGRALGFKVASDRYFIMDLQRRLALGTVSNLLGDLALDIDMESRLTGMTFVAQRVLEGMTQEEGEYLDAFAEGINAYIAAVEAGELPPPSELQAARPLLGASKVIDLMAPFDRASLAAMVAVIMYQTNFESGDIQRDANFKELGSLFEGAPFETLRREGARQDIWEDLRPIFNYSSTPDWAVTDNASEKSGGSGATGSRLQVEKGMLARATQRLDSLVQRLGKKDAENFGSNTWAVAGDAAVDGAALVAGDGHLPLYIPSLMYQVGLNTKLLGEGDIHQAGLLITSLPLLAVGTNGKVAWSQVNPVADITDWYREELVLDESGLPSATVFEGESRALNSVEERHDVADVPGFGSVGREVVWTRYTTFDGRFLFEVEGRELAEDEEAEEGEAVVLLAGRRVVPGDRDEDGKITAISFDYTAFDTTGYMSALEGLTEAETVRDYQEATKGFIGNMLYSAVADSNGDILFTSYQGVPCRGYLPRDESGRWLEGSDPTMLIDGTRFGGFTVPSGPDGKVDESQAEDPYRCVVPFDETPQVINPEAGFVVNANNQPAPITDDKRIDDEPWYIGGPWSSVRADSISGELEKAVTAGTADIAKMAEIQGHTRSRLGERFAPALIAALELSQSYAETDAALEPHQERLAEFYRSHGARLTEVHDRLVAWVERGYGTSAGVETFYDTPTSDDVEDSVATMIFNAFLPRVLALAFDDEGMGAAYRYRSGRTRVRALDRFLTGRGEENPEGLRSWNEATGESIFFDVLESEEVERSEEILVAGLVASLDYLAGPGTGSEGGFNTEEMSSWRWGLRHKVRFESVVADFLPGNSGLSFLVDALSITTRNLPLAQGTPSGDPRRELKWFPRPGDNFSVDAASPGFSGTDFTYANGPVMRMVISLKGGEVRGQNIVPGGQSGLITSPFFADQAALWLGNETVPLRYHIADIAEGAVGREVLTP